MTFTRSRIRIGALGLLGLCLAGGVGRSQRSQPGQIPGPTTPDPFGQNPDTKSRNDHPFGDPEQKQARLRDDERQKRLVVDTDRLLTLATQLHDDVAKTDKHMLSIDVVKRAEEIEKLAHSVKEREKS